MQCQAGTETPMPKFNELYPSPSSSVRAAQSGFTLIEIMVVVIIIGLLAAVVVPQFLGRVDDARVAKAKQDIQAMETALTMFKLDNYTYPTPEMGLKALAQKPTPHRQELAPRRLPAAPEQGPLGERLPVPGPGHARRGIRPVLAGCGRAARR